MAARVGLLTQQGLGEALRSQLKHPYLKNGSVFLVFIAILIGNAAYEAGNISGAALGISGLFGETKLWSLIIGIVAVSLLLAKSRVVELVLLGLVIVMSLVFTVTAIWVQPDLPSLIQGLIPDKSHFSQISMLSVLALVGTTIVPYNLFLHASIVKSKWKEPNQLGALRIENAIAVCLGGLISMVILITSAATVRGSTIAGIDEMSLLLEPLLGSWSRYFIAVGLFAAGISSSVTAPLAAAYAAKGIFGWSGGTSGLRFRLVWAVIISVGVLFSGLGYRPVKVIQIAQIANGILLPIMVFFLLYLCNQKKLLGQYKNTSWQNGLGLLVLVICLLISIRSLNGVFGFL